MTESFRTHFGVFQVLKVKNRDRKLFAMDKLKSTKVLSNHENFSWKFSRVYELVGIESVHFSAMNRLVKRYVCYFLGFVSLCYLVVLNNEMNSDDDEYRRSIMEAMPQVGDERMQRFGPGFGDVDRLPNRAIDKVKSPKRQKPRRNLPEKIIFDEHNDEIVDLIDPPDLPDDILKLHKLFDLHNPGHLGQPVILPDNLPLEYQLKINQSRAIYSINEFVSKLIPYYRELPDVRPVYCRDVLYSANLPVTSVIMVFHNEPFSLIMRSVFAVFKRTPPHLLGEILLVDDSSTHNELKQYLEDFIRPYKKIRLFRSPIRLGLIKARIFGCVNAKGPVLVFMDAHIEVTPGWLEPLLDPIAKNPNTTTLPVVDALNKETLAYQYNDNPET